jgi:hypothetical protein
MLSQADRETARQGDRLMVRKGDRQAVRQRDKRYDRETRAFRQRDNVPTENRQEVRGIHARQKDKK